MTALSLLASVLLAAEPLSAIAPDLSNPTCPSLSSLHIADDRKLTFRLDRSGDQKILIVDGKINIYASVLLDQALKANAPVDEIWINSPGGYAEEGMRLGQVIRKWGVPTRVVKGAWCASACNFMFLGGPIRTIDEGGVYGVHMFSEVTQAGFQPEIEKAYRPGGVSQVLSDIARVEQDSAETASKENDYMIRMGVSRKLLSEIMYKQKSTAFQQADPSTVRCLTRDEEQRYNVTNIKSAR